MADQQGQAALGQFMETGVNAIFGLHVECSGRLIQDQDLAIAQICTRKRQLLPFAAGELALAQLASQQRIQALWETLQQRFASCLDQRVKLAFVVAQVFEPPQADVLACRKLIAPKVLEDGPHLATQLAQVVFAQVHPVEQDTSACGIIEPQQQLDHRCLPGAIVPHQRHTFPRQQAERDIVQYLHSLPWIGEAHLLKHDTLADLRRRGSRMLCNGQVRRCLDDTQQARQKVEVYGEQASEEAQTQHLRLQQRRRTTVEGERANADLAVDHQPDDVEVDRS